jgi:hypothetical protein
VEVAQVLRPESSLCHKSEVRLPGTRHATSRAEVTMKPNVILAERSTRMGLGAVLLASPLLELPTYPFNLLGLVLMVTAAAGYCPLYGLLSSFRPGSATKGAPLARSERRHEAAQAHPAAN